MTASRVLYLNERTQVAVGRIDDLLAVPTAPGDPTAPLWRRRETAASRMLLRRLLLEFDADQEPMAARPGGQPHLPGRPDLAISLSHTAGWVAAAVQVGDSNGAVAIGVDIETPTRVGDRLIVRCTSPTDRRLLARLPEPRRVYEFTAIWTVQEACVKAAGSGLAGRPWTIPVRVGQRTGCWQTYRWWCLRDEFPAPVSCAFRHDC